MQRPRGGPAQTPPGWGGLHSTCALMSCPPAALLTKTVQLRGAGCIQVHPWLSSWAPSPDRQKDRCEQYVQALEPQGSGRGSEEEVFGGLCGLCAA